MKKLLRLLITATLMSAAAYANAQSGRVGEATVEPAGCPVARYVMVRIMLDGAPYMRCAKVVFGVDIPTAGSTVLVRFDFSNELEIIGIAK